MGAYQAAPDHCWAKIWFDFRGISDLEPVIQIIQEMRAVDRDTALLRIKMQRQFMEALDYAPDAGVWMKFNMHQLGKYLFLVGRSENAIGRVRVLKYVADESDIPEGDYVLPVGLKAHYSASEGMRASLPWYGGPLTIEDRIIRHGGDPSGIDVDDLGEIIAMTRRLGCRCRDLVGV